jgi:hypothetical protein
MSSTILSTSSHHYAAVSAALATDISCHEIFLRNRRNLKIDPFVRLTTLDVQHVVLSHLFMSKLQNSGRGRGGSKEFQGSPEFPRNPTLCMRTSTQDERSAC